MHELGEQAGLLLPVVVPVAAGLAVLMTKGLDHNRRVLLSVVLGTLLFEVGLVAWALAAGGRMVLWRITDSITLTLSVDMVSRLFAALTSGVWLLVGIYSVAYMAHEHKERRFFGFYLIVLGVLIGLDFSGNLITMYVFYELMTLTSLPLVLHEGTKEAVMAGLKYLFYSVAGAFLALFGIFVLMQICGNVDFTPGGVIARMEDGAMLCILQSSIPSHPVREGLFLAALFCMLTGFGAKAGMFPLHGWLPTAHPVAPAPASAVLSGVITKSGVLAILRVIYFVAGPKTLEGTWVQNVWIFLTLITVFMGSMLAYREPVLKKRLAYSTVSQVSYVLFGLSVLEPQAFAGALSHVVFHSLIKNALFLSAGAIIAVTGRTQVKEMRGLGSTMPVLLGCYTVVSLALVGIPPASGFVSKWYLATGALASETGIWTWLGPVVLLVSALLTAGYLLPLTIQGFFPGKDSAKGSREENPSAKKGEAEGAGGWMLGPIGILTAGALLFGCFPGGLMALLHTIGAGVL